MKEYLKVGPVNALIVKEVTSTALLNAVIDAVPSANLLIDTNGAITDVKVSNRQVPKSRAIVGRSLSWTLRRIFNPSTVELIVATYRQCLATGNVLELTKIEHVSTHNFREYSCWHFTPLPEMDSVSIYVRDVTETVLMEEEFDTVADKYMEVNQELRQAMSTLDLQLMDIDQAHKKLTALYHITSIVQKTVDQREVLDAILDSIIQEWNFIKVAIFLVDENRQELVVKAHRGFYENIRIPMQQGVIGYAATHSELIHVPDITTDSRYIPTGDILGAHEVAVPLIVNDSVIGVLDVEGSQERVLNDYDLNLLRSLAGQIALTIAHASHVAQVEVEAITDPLTGLYNKRYFNSLIDKEVRRSVRYSRPLCMLMIDIDHYKLYNDACGHRMGDEVLRMVAEIIRRTCRDVDFVARYGGEEFVVLLPETEIQDAVDIAVRVRCAIEDHSFPLEQTQPGGRLTVSIGVSGCLFDALTEAELIDHSDAALYVAKRTGRNCVCKYPDICEKREIQLAVSI